MGVTTQNTSDKEEVVKIQERGLLTISKKFRQDLSLLANSFARVKKEKGRLIIEPVRILPYPVRSYIEEDLQDFLALDRKESKKLKKAGLL